MEDILEKALENLKKHLETSTWQGRENEVVNLFAHSFLISSEKIKPAQIGIEVAVKQLPSTGGKKLVRKDLVIWPEENMTVWDEKGEVVSNPLVIMEWKVNDEGKCKGDIEWLKKYTKKYPKVVGYSVCAFIKGNRGLVYKKIVKGEVVGR